MKSPPLEEQAQDRRSKSGVRAHGICRFRDRVNANRCVLRKCNQAPLMGSLRIGHVCIMAGRRAEAGTLGCLIQVQAGLWAKKRLLLAVGERISVDRDNQIRR